MDRRWYSSPLRGVKRGVIALSIVMLSLSSSVLFPRPAHAEGFLGQTVRCVLGVLVLKDCRTVQQPTAPASPIAPSSPPANSGQVQNTQTPDTSSQQPASPGTSEGQSGGAVYVQPEPLNAGGVETTPPPAPELPQPRHRQSFTYEPATYAAYHYGMVKGEQTVAQAVVIEPTREGWRIVGVAWYWWAAGIALASGGVLWRKKRKHKENLSIAK